MNHSERIEAAKRARSPQPLLDAIPYAKHLGVTLSLQGDQLVGELAFSQSIIGDLGVATLHSGAIATLLEATAMVSLLWEVETTAAPQKISSTVKFVEPGKPRSTFAKAVIHRHGRRIVNLRLLGWQDSPSDVIAIADYHFLLAAPAALV